MSESPTEILLGIIIILSAAVSIVALFYRMKISPLIGYFVSGAVIGAHGLGLVQSHSIIDILGEFGIVFLLFLIGLELTFERLIAMRRHLFGLGGLQIILTTLSITILSSYYYGLTLKASVVIGGGLALSSTAVVLQLLQEKKATSSQVGRLSIAILILQDLAVVPLLVLVPLLLSPESSRGLFETILQALTKALFALILIFVVGRLLIRPFFNMVASTKNDELFIATTLLIVLGTAYITNYFNLSMALGAFVAGLLMAETEHCHEVEQVILPFKKLLLGLFFMTIGMSIDLHLLSINLTLIMLLSILLMVIKATIIILICLLFSSKKSSAINTGLLLSQGGEFAFILFNLDATQEIIPHEIAQVLMAVVTITMALTPLFSYFGKMLSKIIENEKIKRTVEQILDYDTMNIDQYVAIAGFGRAGEMIAKVLDAEQISYIGVDVNSEIVNKSQNEGCSTYCGDVTDINVLKSMHLERARAIIISISNQSIVKKTIKLIKQNFPDINIIVRVPDLSNAKGYYKIGADKLVPETYEIGLQLGAAMLSSIGFSDISIAILKERFRRGNYITTKNESYEDV
ncbi:MAG: cation:proton antiporter [Rickettsiaceae bacterium H1]|nr:cation:proton antiporter [Rickettsiaceae bacterium H1]